MKAPALPPGAHRHVPRALWLFAQKQECRHLIGLETGVQVAESHYLAKRYHMMCSSITQLLFDFFPRNSSPTTFRAADKAAEVLASRCMNAASPRRRGPSSRLCLQLTLLQRRAISPYGTAAGSTQFGSRPVPLARMNRSTDAYTYAAQLEQPSLVVCGGVLTEWRLRLTTWQSGSAARWQLYNGRMVEAWHLRQCCGPPVGE